MSKLFIGPQYGRGASGTASSAQNAAHDPRWQHPEKQKTLIHTAPVLSPTKVMTGSSDSSGWARGGKDQNAVNMEVSQTVQFHQILDSLLFNVVFASVFVPVSSYCSWSVFRRSTKQPWRRCRSRKAMPNAGFSDSRYNSQPLMRLTLIICLQKCTINCFLRSL